MPEITVIVQHSIFYGAILAFSVCALFLIGAYLNPEVMLQGYPPEIKRRYGEGSAAAKRQRVWLSIPVSITLFGALILAIAQLPPASNGVASYLAITLCVFIMLFTLNVVDLVVNDWLIFNTLRPKFIILPGTEGMAGYGDYGFHFKQFLKGTLGSLIASPIIAAIATGIDILLSNL
jgi:hypothetical protein